LLGGRNRLIVKQSNFGGMAQEKEGQKCELFGGAVLMRLAWGRQHESAR
jgi:hypothetical protein